jgi:23S rRNA (adenine2503-C2)-methyltransferase
MGCRFCATATLGLKRHLTASGDRRPGARRQPRGARTRQLATLRPVTNLVFMGMGEPLHNFENVKLALGAAAVRRGAQLLGAAHHGVHGGLGSDD